MSHPFQPIPKEKQPKRCYTDYCKDSDVNIITYMEIEKVKMTGDKDTDFVISKEIIVDDKVNRQKYLDSQSNDVGIMNIIEKVRLSGDASLLNQTGRVSMAAVEKDSAGHDVEPVVDVTRYQVEQIDALESYKIGAAAFDSLDPELKKKLSLEQVAKLSDAEIDAFLNGRKAKIEAAKKKKEAAEGE